MKRILLVAVFCSCLAHDPSAQSLHLSKKIYNTKDYIQGVFYKNSQISSTSYYRLSLIANDGNVLVHGYLTPKRSFQAFNIPIPEDIETDTYLVLAQNIRFPKEVIIEPILILGKEEKSQFKVPINLWRSKTESSQFKNFNSTVANDSISIRFNVPDEIENISISVTDSLQDLKNLPVRYFQSTKQNSISYSEYFVKGAIEIPSDNQNINPSYYLASRIPSLEITSIRIGTNNTFSIRESELINREDFYLQAVTQDLITGPDISSISSVPNYYNLDLSWDRRYIDSTLIKRIVRLEQIRKRVEILYPPILQDSNNPLESSSLLDLDNEFDLTEYVDMETTTQLFREIVSNVFVRKSKIRVFSPERRSSLSGNVLKLINGAIATDNQVLSLSPEQIHYIGVINSEFKLIPFLGLAPGGVVSITTFDNEITSDLATKIPTFTTNYDYRPSVQFNSSSDTPYFSDQVYWSERLVEESGLITTKFRKPSHDTRLFITVFVQTQKGDLIKYEETVESN